MSITRKIKKRADRRSLRVRKKIREFSNLPRVSVFRSLRYIYAQVIDDVAQKTLVSFSTLQLSKVKGDKKEQAHAVGVELAKKALAKGISKVVFDRGQYLYHGRVKALAEGIREGGLAV